MGGVRRASVWLCRGDSLVFIWLHIWRLCMGLVASGHPSRGGCAALQKACYAVCEEGATGRGDVGGANPDGGLCAFARWPRASSQQADLELLSALACPRIGLMHLAMCACSRACTVHPIFCRLA